jgi:MSHA biogenesis protein MshJ
VKDYWRKVSEWVDAKSLRERALVFAALLTFLIAIFYSAFLDPEFATSRRLSQEISQRQGEIRALQDEISKVLQARQQDPDRVNRTRLAGLKASLADADARIAAEERKFTAPAQMREVIKELLARNRGVKLVGMKTLPVSSIPEGSGIEVALQLLQQAAKSVAKPQAVERVVFRHGIELTVSGSYLDLLTYIVELEKLPSQLYWGALDLDASQYPNLQLKLTLFTLSLDRAWLNV